jgi:uncharacterized protein involved in exopolysaccharide biosynthesis
MAASLELARKEAQQNVDWYTQQMDKAKVALDAAVGAEASYERANNIVMQDKGIDVESAHLQSLAQQAASPYLPNPPDQQSATSSFQLAAVEAQLVSATKTLGPNNPEVLELKAKQASLSALVARDRANSEAALRRSMEGGAKALENAVNAQQSKVLSHSEVIGRLNQLHQDVELRTAEYKELAQKVSHFRQLASSGDAGITSLGTALTPKEPTFPNYILIIPGALVLGLGVGVLVSLLMELLGRRVRTADDLNLEDDLPLICVISGLEKTRGPIVSRLIGWRNWWPLNRGAVGA